METLALEMPPCVVGVKKKLGGALKKKGVKLGLGLCAKKCRKGGPERGAQKEVVLCEKCVNLGVGPANV